ncbi:MAG: helix-turn-helix domain-containing protein [Armatimonadota bacterium]
MSNYKKQDVIFAKPENARRRLVELKNAFAKLETAFFKKWSQHCVLCDIEGNTIYGNPSCREEIHPSCEETRKKAIEESLRWGEPSMQLCPGNYVAFAVPVMVNAIVIGGIVVEHVEVGQPGITTNGLSTTYIRQAALDLLSYAERTNLTNSSLLLLRRISAQRESERAEAIHEIKDQNYQSIRDLYLVEEPNLIAAIKQGEKAAAIEILNRVLVGIYFLGRERPTLLKSLLLELVVTMSRSAVEAGGDPTELLGANYSSFAELARIDSEEELCSWLVSMLERAMDAIKKNRQYPNSTLLSEALRYMKEHLNENISRDEVAEIACLSPSHFSRVVKQTLGFSFTDLLSRMRVERAREMLLNTDKNLIQISIECGFNDQSYFTKVFQKYVGKTPGDYRRGLRTPRPPRNEEAV